MKNKHIAVLVGSLVAMSGQALAQAPTSASVKPQYQIGGAKPGDDAPKGMSLGDGITLFPTAKLGFGRDDNLFLANTNKKSSDLISLEAGALVEARRQNQIFTLGLDARSANYNDSSADNYRDYSLRGGADLQFSARSGLRLGAVYDRGHDPRGSTDRGVAERPDVYRDNTVDALYAFGGNEARGRFELAASSANKRYRNNRATTAAADRDTDRLRGTFFMRVAPKTSVLFEVQQSNLDYVTSGSTLDSEEKRYYGGITWEATAATSGTIKLGRQKKEFEAGSRTSNSSSSWEIGVEWKPMSYAKVDLFSNKSFGESSGVGDLIINKRTGATWTHNWNSRIATEARYVFAQDDFVGAGASRKDETDTFGIKLTYKLGRMLELGADFTRSDRDSNQANFVYKRNQVMFTVGAKL
ncbi:MAG: outer membrane beta-barrel protein [Betaproteobacteria bacterium]|nr:outer membrane beta-barrel protein [Betaproteobacteria bacterium]